MYSLVPKVIVIVIVIVVLTYNRQLPFLKNLDKTFKISLIVSAKNPLKS